MTLQSLRAYFIHKANDKLQNASKLNLSRKTNVAI